MVFRIGRSSVYQVFVSAVSAVLQIMPMLGVPFDDDDAMSILAEGFQNSRTPQSPLWGCIAALDGIALPIKKPLDRYYPRNYFIRKGFYALPVQTMCDSSYRFLYMSANCVGSTHDSLAWGLGVLSPGGGKHVSQLILHDKNQLGVFSFSFCLLQVSR
jgi:hypothetical protein